MVPADYAFVLHTAHPVTGERGRVFGEVVMGLGETLVGNYPGKALSFCSQPGAHQPHFRQMLHEVQGLGRDAGGQLPRQGAQLLLTARRAPGWLPALAREDGGCAGRDHSAGTMLHVAAAEVCRELHACCALLRRWTHIAAPSAPTSTDGALLLTAQGYCPRG